MSQSNVELIQGMYAAFGRGDVAAVLGPMAPEIAWREAENFIYADGNPYIGPNAVLNGIFMRCATEWEGFKVTPETFYDAGDHVIVTGRYSGKYLASGRAIDSQFAHFWTIAGGKVIRFEQFTDTLQGARVTGLAAGA